VILLIPLTVGTSREEILSHQSGIDDGGSGTLSARGSGERQRLHHWCRYAAVETRDGNAADRIVARMQPWRQRPSKQGWKPPAPVRQALTRTGTVGIALFSWGRITSDTDHRHQNQNNRRQNHDDANVVSHGPFSRYPIENCGRRR
jgi:hypothetical protein